LLNVEQARALARVADASRLPTVNAGFSSSRLPGANNTVTNSYQAGLQITAYELDLFGRVKNQSEAAMARYLASAEGSRAAQIALVAAVASSYLALQADEELLGLSQLTSTTRADSLRLTRLKFDAGAASALDFSSAADKRSTTSTMPKGTGQLPGK
ncbi:TolC family protein, partial [Roseateles sp. GG27B]